MTLSRRGLFGLLGGSAALLASPAIVRVGSLMPVKAWSDPVYASIMRSSYGSSELYEAGEEIPFGCAVRVGTDGRVYLCSAVEDLYGISTSGFLAPPHPGQPVAIPLRIAS